MYYVVNAKALSIMRCLDDINTEHNMKSIGRAAVAQWIKHLTRNGQTRVRTREVHIFDITDTFYHTVTRTKKINHPVLALFCDLCL